MEATSGLKRGKTRITESRLASVLHLIGREYGACRIDQSQITLCLILLIDAGRGKYGRNVRGSDSGIAYEE